ncbi:MAG TPA: cupin domain-containing protein [Mucilaginibacter sp.]|nr:cupin domain-containing protein [Mucilaginibacter sp.]
MESGDTFGCFEDDLPSERVDTEDFLVKLCDVYEIKPPAGNKQKILAKLNFAGEELELNNLPSTDRYANHISWLKVLEDLMPTEPVETIFMQEIRRDEKIIQTLVVSKVDVPEEIHGEYAESFFILEGHCACTIGGQVFELFAGDYLDIPLHVPHDVKLLSTEVKAIVQYQLA